MQFPCRMHFIQYHDRLDVKARRSETDLVQYILLPKSLSFLTEALGEKNDVLSKLKEEMVAI